MEFIKDYLLIYTNKINNTFNRMRLNLILINRSCQIITNNIIQFLRIAMTDHI